jgi:two-component system response regulator
MEKAKKILVVEDNPDDIELVLMVLNKKKVTNRIDVVSDGQQALDYIFCKGRYKEQDPHELPALILLDLKLPKIDGIEVLRKVRKNRKSRNIPVAIFTSSKEEQDLIDSYDSGANSFIRKPVDSIQFDDTVGRLGVYWLLLNEPPPVVG